MQKIYFLLLFVLFLDSACKKSTTSQPGEVSLTFDSLNYQDNHPKSYLVDGMFTIYSTANNDSSNVSLFFKYPWTLNVPICNGELGWNSTNQSGHIVVAPDTAFLRWGAPTGHVSITITSWDSVGHHIAGTFSSVVYGYPDRINPVNDSVYIVPDSSILTNGSFNLNYSTHPY